MSDRYYYNGSRYVPSGTTVIGMLDKPFLKQWAADCAVDYIDTCYNDPDMIWANVEKKARKAYVQESMEAADYGTYIHKLCEVSLTDDIKIESPHELTQKFMDGLWAWKTKHKVKVIAMEHEVVTDTYGGRIDLVCEMDGVVTLVDFKTGGGAYYNTWKYQLAGYRQAWNSDVISHALQDEYDTNGTTKDFNFESVTKAIKSNGILKFNKKTGKVNYKAFDEYQATRTNPETKEKEKYTRNYETDRATFNSLVANWWLVKRGIEI